MHAKAKNLRAMLVDSSRSDGVERIKHDALDYFETACREGQIGLDPRGSKSSGGARKTFRIQDLASAFLGDNWEKAYKDQVSLRESAELMEAPAMVTSQLFPKITQQLIFSEVRRQFDVEANALTPIVPVVPSDIKGTEVVPSITNIDPDDLAVTGEGEPYHRVGVTEEYFTLPAKTKSGGVIELTREAIRFDRTNMLVDQARAIGAALGAKKENALIDALIGQTNNYSRNGTASNTYLTAGAYINNQSSLPLGDWTDVDTALQLFAGILDPNTSEPLAGAMNPKHLVVMPYKRMTAKRILTASGARSAENLAAGSRSEETVNEQNPLAELGLQLVSSNRIYQRVLAGPEGTASTAREGWFLGSIDELLAWYECWPLEVLMQGRDSDASFDRDIEMKFKACYFGVAAVREARKMLRLESTAW